MSTISSNLTTFDVVQNSQIQSQEPEVQKDKKLDTQEPTEAKVKIEKVEEKDPAYEKLKVKEVGFLARAAMKAFANIEINELIKMGIIKEGDAKHTNLKKLLDSKPKTYGDLDKIAVEVNACLFEGNEVGKEKGIQRIKKFLTTYDAKGIASALAELKKMSSSADKKNS